jgi:ABC-type lipoprotein release transport system permease subunit
VVLIAGVLLTQAQIFLTAFAVFTVAIGMYLAFDPSALAEFNLRAVLALTFIRLVGTLGTIVLTVMFDRPFLDSFSEIDQDLPGLRFVLQRRIALTKAMISVGSTMILMGLSLMPLSALLLALPAVNPDEAVLTDVVARTRSRWVGLARRAAGVLTAVALLLAIVAFATEIITRLNLSGDTFYGTISRKVLPASLTSRLPHSLVDQWPYVIFLIYMIDLAILAVIAKVPFSYSLRNLIVRWHITALTAVAFIVVLFMLTFMLAFVNGMTKLTEQSGHPGNVLVLSDGATDELFSNLGYGDVDNIDRIRATEDEFGNPLPKPIAVKTMKVDGKSVYLGSRETYCVINHLIPNTNRRRFIQVRIIVDAPVSAAVHQLDLVDKSHSWFTRTGVNDKSQVECVLGQGVAATLGEDVGKKTLQPGDTFELGDLIWIVTGIMKTEGTTFGSEVWCSNLNKVTDAFGKKSYTTYVLRVDDETEAGARAMAYHIRNRYQTQKLKAVPEKEYFAELNKNNQQTLYTVIVVAVVMAIGGIFGVMNTMYAAIAQRTKDIGVLRLLGFKRWQVLVAFLLESMTIALIGGLAGVLLGSLCNGFEVTSIASSGQGGGGKTVAAKLVVDRDVFLIGILFTLVMGRLGGLVPALSAMRLKILESLR